jgi:REP-associated tyrosine transposase
MSHSYSQNHLHIVFSTKDRQKLIEPAMQPKLWSYMAGIGRNHGFLVLANGGMEDHVHLLIQLPPVLALAKAISVVKANSSTWMNDHGTKFNWQEGYGAFSVSASKLAVVERYIANQERHHRKRSYEQEFKELLKKHGIPFDPKYVFG